MNRVTKLRQNRTQGAAEYIVLVGVLAVGATAAVANYGDAIKAAFQAATGNLSRTIVLRVDDSVKKTPEEIAAEEAARAKAEATKVAKITLVPDDASKPTGKVKLSWTAPATKTDGSPVTLAGYKVYYGTASKAYGTPITIGTETAVEIDGLEVGQTYYFALSTFDTNGVESGLSNEVIKTVEP